ncbi:MAG: hypothetical protein U9R39_03285 [Campylobacterota bacterium]|nr:hypothetical protein [Campylobacterota bacterium]
MINIKLLLLLSLILMGGVYSIFLSQKEVLDIVKSEYILISINIVFLAVLLFFKNKLKETEILNFLKNTNSVSLKSTLLFFLIFQAVDFYYEDGFLGMISQWFMYWLFAILALLLTNNINYYKNYKYYNIKS